MLLQRINRTSPEKIFTSVKVEEANGLVEGDCVKWSTTNSLTYPLGVAVIKSAALATDLLLAGIVWNSGRTDTIVQEEFAMIQTYGVHTNVKIAGALAAANLPITSTATAGQAGAGLAADDPAARIGVSLTAVSGGRATCFLRVM